MFNRKELKKKAKQNIKHHYFRNVIIVFICSLLLTGNFSNSRNSILEIDPNSIEIKEVLNDNKLTKKEIIDKILLKTKEEKKIEDKINEKYYDGVLSTFVNEITKSGSFIYGLLNGFNKLILEEKVDIAIIIILSNIILFIFNAIFLRVLEIGKNRFFIEQRKYRNTKLEKLLFPYKIKKTLHLAYILFIKTLYEILWFLTIIGGFIKHYEYKLIPYILAETPNITKKEAFKLSKELTNNEKFNLFKVDLSLIGWSLLNVITLNLSGIFYSNIYKETLYSEIYMELRNKKKDIIENGKLLNDTLLEIEKEVDGSYPDEKYNIKPDKTKKWLKIDYNKSYDLKTYILLFFTFAMIGWIWEVFYHLVNHGVFVNRGTMHGPWLPIYGFGGIMILFFLKRFREKPFQLFLSSFILCGIVEYTTAWYLETFKHLKYWDYTGYFLNIDGRICLEGLLLFGLGGCAFTYFLAPILDNIYKKINSKIKTAICIILLTVFISDFIYTSQVPNTGKGISKQYHLSQDLVNKQKAETYELF